MQIGRTIWFFSYNIHDQQEFKRYDLHTNCITGTLNTGTCH